MKPVLFAILLISVPLVVISGASDKVADIHSNNFGDTVVKNPEVYVVKLFSSMCGSCQDFQPTWNTLVPELSKKYKLGQVNIDKSEGMSLANKLNGLREGIPALMIFNDQVAENYQILFVDGMSKEEVSSSIDKLTNNNSVNGEGLKLKKDQKADM
mmetsp:Transcript_33697/g.34987  ORF Transcript_33697/g.34987 Transcript_33697/m.34987 type:complete len:156 (-) Transcript_33697:101-568(-)